MMRKAFPCHDAIMKYELLPYLFRHVSDTDPGPVKVVVTKSLDWVALSCLFVAIFAIIDMYPLLWIVLLLTPFGTV